MRQHSVNKQLVELSQTIGGFIEKVQNRKSTLMATDQWTVKDVLCHIVFWHENYAANYKALAEHKEPPLLDGPGQRLNHEGVASLRKYSMERLFEKLKKAQTSLHESIIEKNVPEMTYKKNGRVYKTPDFLYMVTRHIITHTKHVKRAA